NNLPNSYNTFSPGASCQDNGGHGTHLSGLIAVQNNSIGIVGVAPAAKLYGVKVLDSNITGADSVIMAGLDWVVQKDRWRAGKPWRIRRSANSGALQSWNCRGCGRR